MRVQVADELCVPPSHPSLPGHFPGDAIVPGVLLLSLVLEQLRLRFGPFEVRALRSVKFLRPLRPGEPFHVEAEERAPSLLRFACRSRGAALAEGSVQIAR